MFELSKKLMDIPYPFVDHEYSDKHIRQGGNTLWLNYLNKRSKSNMDVVSLSSK